MVLARPSPWLKGLDKNKCDDWNLCVCVLTKNARLSDRLFAQTGHVEKQEDHQVKQYLENDQEMFFKKKRRQPIEEYKIY